MKVTFFAITSVLLALCSFQAFGWGIGVEGGYGLGTVPGGNAMLTMKLDNLPLFGVGLAGDSSNLSLGLTADWWLMKETLADSLILYVGPGAYAGFQSDKSISVGGRVPIGVQVYPLKWLELFIEVAPRVGVTFSSSPGIDWGLMGALGARFWFDSKPAER